MKKVLLAVLLATTLLNCDTLKTDDCAEYIKINIQYDNYIDRARESNDAEQERLFKIERDKKLDELDC